MTDDIATPDTQPTLQALAQNLEVFTQRPWHTFTDQDQQRNDLMVAMLLSLAKAVIALQSGTSAGNPVQVGVPAEAGTPALPTDEQLQALIAPLVAEAISTAFGKLESATVPAA